MNANCLFAAFLGILAVMPLRVLLTAFEPFGGWSENSSLLCLNAVMEGLQMSPLVGVAVTPRVLPVDFAAARDVVEEEISKSYNFALHLGQAAGSAALRLESFAINVGVQRVAASPALEWGAAALRTKRAAMSAGSTHFRLVNDGPAAYESALPLADWLARLLTGGVPAERSFHAGTYLCNAVYYWSSDFARRSGGPTQAAFIHVPLAPSQAAEDPAQSPTLDVGVAAAGVRIILETLALSAWV